jgi:hypothetical protein
MGKTTFSSVSHKGDEVFFSTNSVCAEDIVGMFGHFLLGCGFSHDTVACYVNHYYFCPPPETTTEEQEHA